MPVRNHDKMAPLTKWRLFLVYALCLALRIDKVESSQELMHKLSVTFFKAIEECKTELGISNDLMQSLMNFWREDQDLGNRDLGCVVLCLATKHDLVEMAEYKLHHQKTYDFAMSHGADDETAKKLVKIVNECEKQFEANEDHCSRILEVARCFKKQIHGLKWAPNMEVLMGEIMVDM